MHTNLAYSITIEMLIYLIGVGMVTNSDCKHDSIQSYLEGKALGTPVSSYLD